MRRPASCSIRCPTEAAPPPRTIRRCRTCRVLVSQALVNGLLLGGLYACVAVGFSLIWGGMHLINPAHGSFALLYPLPNLGSPTTAYDTALQDLPRAGVAGPSQRAPAWWALCLCRRRVLADLGGNAPDQSRAWEFRAALPAAQLRQPHHRVRYGVAGPAACWCRRP